MYILLISDVLILVSQHMDMVHSCSSVGYLVKESYISIPSRIQSLLALSLHDFISDRPLIWDLHCFRRESWAYDSMFSFTNSSSLTFLQAFLFLSSILPKHCFSHFPNVFLSFLSFRDITVAASWAPVGMFQLSLTTSRNSSEARSHIASNLNLLGLGLPISSGDWYVVQHWTVNYFDLGQWETVFPLCWNQYPIKSSKRRILSYVAPMKILSIIGRSIMARSCMCWTFPYPGRFHPLLFFLLGIALCWNFPQDLR